MPVQVFIGRTAEGQALPPEYNHEMLSTLQIIRLIWTAFHARQPYYAVAVKLADPSADLVLVSERGVGVLELKHYFGRIGCRSDGGWYAGPKRIVAGVEGRGFQNPHEQVQFYAEQIRARLIDPPPFQRPWLPGRTVDWQEFKFQTGVCFTHPEADLAEFDDLLRKRCRPITLPWEHFSVFKESRVADWVSALRFEGSQGGTHGPTQHRWEPEQISRVLGELFDLTPWAEVAGLMPGGRPYAYLSLIENNLPVQDFNLDREEILIGRDGSLCDVAVPERYTLVSRTHARIVRTSSGIHLEDLDSTNGTFLDGRRVEHRLELVNGGRITLGRAQPGPGVCLLEFNLEVQSLHDNLQATQKLESDQPR